MGDIILHHYPQSPVSEKVRVALGIKGLTWRSVEIPRIPPKPDLMPLTGGYRRTPVMQVGADIYCDSLCILRALERHAPEPTLHPNGAPGRDWAIGRWTDDAVFDLAVKIVLGAAPEDLPEAFAKDRARLYFGPDWDLAKVHSDLPHVIAQVRGHFGWLDNWLDGGGSYLAGESPGLTDAFAYYLVWFVRGRWDAGPPFLAEFPALEAWEARVRALGHGTPTPMAAADALDIARASEPATPASTDPRDPQGLTPGMPVSVVPDSDGGDPAVGGEVRFADRETIAIIGEHPRVGAVCMHFPRVGYRVTISS